MKKYVSGLSRGILLLIFLVACLPGQAQEEPRGGVSSIQGKVADADSGTPIPYARVLLVHSNGMPVGQTITTLQGTFSFEERIGELARAIYDYFYYQAPTTD